MFPNIPWWVFIVVGAVIGGPAGVILGAKAATKKWLIMKAVTGATVGGAMGLGFGLLNGPGGGIGPNGPPPRNGEGTYVIRINADTTGDRIDNIRLDLLIGDSIVERASLKHGDDISNALRDFTQRVTRRSDENIVRITEDDKVPRTIMDHIYEDLRLGGVRLALEVPHAD